MLGIGSTENVIALREDLKQHPGTLSESALEDLARGIAIDFPLSGKL